MKIFPGLWLCFMFLGEVFASGVAGTPVLYGVARNGEPLRAELHPALLDVSDKRTRVLVVASDGDPAALRATASLIDKLKTEAVAWSREFPAVALGFVGPPPGAAGGNVVFPPEGKAYGDPVTPEAIYLWRWIGMVAPDVVVDVRSSEFAGWQVPESGYAEDAAGILGKLPAVKHATMAAGDLPAALVNHAVCDVGRMPAVRLCAASPADLKPLLQLLQERPVRSAARRELLRRTNRNPLEVAQELGRVYGQRLDEVSYIPAVALVAQLRLGTLVGDASRRGEVERLVRPYHAKEKPALPEKSNGSQQAGHLLFGELADITGDDRYTRLLRAAADLGFDHEGRMLEAMPAHAEMSDAVFLGTPLLAQAARISGEAKYREMAMRHLRFLMKLNQRPDGLHRHSPVAPDQTAWGRGNAFVSMGLALSLSELPENSAEFHEVLTMYRAHLAAMTRHQDEWGMWHQVIDHPESYREFTVTCMTTFAVARGLRRGWLDRGIYEPVVRRAWRSIQQRTGPDGSLVDVCAGTGKMKSLREYLDRPAVLGRDERGGAMAFLLCTELAFAEREGVLALKWAVD